MAPTRMKLRLRRRDGAAGGSNAAGGAAGQAEEEEERSRESSSRSRRKKSSSATSAAPSSSPPTSSASARAAAAEEASPDSKCPICLDRFNNLAYLDRCLHRFCFPCIQEWSHNKAECPLCKQPFASILHSVRAEDDFKEYTPRPTHSHSSAAAAADDNAGERGLGVGEELGERGPMYEGVRIVRNNQVRLILQRLRAGLGGETTTAARRRARADADADDLTPVAALMRNAQQLRLMLRGLRAVQGGDATTATARRRRERGGRGGGGGRGWERRRDGEWYLPPLLALPPLPHHPTFSPDADEDGQEEEERGVGPGEELGERGVIFDGLTGLGGAVAPVAPNDRSSRRLMTRLAARRRLQQEGGSVRRLRERETLAFRRALYRSGVRVRGVAGSNQGQQQRDVTAETYRRNPGHLNRLRPWLRRELTVLYGAHGSLVDIVQRIIMARLAHHGLEDTPTIEEELRPFLLARTEHFLHELLSFARSPLSLENYDLQAVYEPPAAAMELDTVSSSTDDSVIAISEGEGEGEEGTGAGGGRGGRSEETQFALAEGAHDVVQTGSSLSLSVWDDETPGPSYSTAEPSHSLAPLSVSPVREEGANEEAVEGEERREKKEEEEEEECLIVGYVKPMAERTPELVQLSSDTEEEEQQQQEEEKKKEEDDKKEEARTAEAPLPAPPPLPLPSVTSPLPSPPTIPPSTSSTNRVTNREREGRSWSGSSGRSSPSPGGREGRRARERKKERERDRSRYPESTERRSKKRKRRGQEREEEGRLRRRDSSGGRGSYNPNRSIYPAMLRRSQSPSPFLSSSESRTMSPPSLPASPWEFHHSGPSSLSSSSSSLSSRSSPSSWCSSPLPPLPAALSPSVRGGAHHGDKPGGKRKYKSRHLDDDLDDPTWQPASGRRGDKRRERGRGGGERESKRRGRDGGRRRERGRRDSHRENSVYDGESSRGCREGRSPSVEIIYEGTITSTTPRPPAHKRHRKRHRKTRRSSSPVVITIDSDSSRDDVNNSSPLSNQQTVDFSDLPPLPLVDSGGVGRHLGGDISELPVDILDRGSDRSEAELDSRSKVVDPVALDDSDSNSDGLDNHEDARCLLARDDNEDNSNTAISHNKASPAGRRSPVEKPVVTTAAAVSRSFVNVPTCREAVVADLGSQPVGESNTGQVARDRSILLDRERETEAKQKDSGFANSDTGLLATILNDLEGISEPKRELAFNIDPEHSQDPRKRLLGGQVRLNQDSWVAEEKMVVGSGDVNLSDLNSPECQAVGSPSPTHRASFPPPPPLQRLKEREVCEEARDLPPLLKHGPPVSSSNRNAPPLLKHKDESSPRHPSISPVSPVDPHFHPIDTQSHPFVSNSTRFNTDWDAVVSSVDSGSVAVVPPTDLQSSSAISPIHSRATELPANDRAIPPIVTLKRHFADAAASREDRASTSRMSSVDLHSSCHLPPTDSHSKASSGSKSRVSTVDSHSPGLRSRSTLCADRLPPIDFLSFPGFSSGRGSPPTINSKEMPPSSPGISPIELHPVNSVSSVDFCSSKAGCPKETPAQGSSTSQVVRKETKASCHLVPVGLHCMSQESPFDLCPPGGVSAKETPASSDTFSGVDLNELPPPVCVSLVDTRSGNSSSPTDFHSSFEVSSRERLSERCASSGVGSKGKPASDTGLSKTDLNPKSHKFPSDLHSSSTASERKITSTSPRSPIDFLSPGAVATIDRHCNSTASSASPADRTATSHSAHRESGSTSRLTIDSHSQPQHPTNTCSQSQFPIGAHSKPSRRDSSFCHTDNHVAPHPQASVENQWNSLSSIDVHSDTQSPMDEHSAGRPDSTSSIWNKHTHTLQLD